MPLTLGNPVAAQCNLDIKMHQKTLERAGNDLNSGYKTENDVVSAMIASRMDNDSTILMAVNKNIQYGVMITEKSLQDLTAARNILNKIKSETLVPTHNASDDARQQLLNRYNSAKKEAHNILTRSSVDGRQLFDHAGNLDIQIRAGVNLDRNITISLPDLRNHATHLMCNNNVNHLNNYDIVNAPHDNDNDNQDLDANIDNDDGIDVQEQYIDQMIMRLDTSINDIKGTQEQLKEIYDVNAKEVQYLNKTRDQYVKADLQQCAEDFKNAVLSTRAAIAVTQQGNTVAQLAISLIEGR